MTVGEKIKAVRKEQNIPQRELAKKIGITQQSLSAIEKGDSDPRIATLMRIEEVTGIRMLYKETTNMTIKFKKTDHRATMPYHGSAEACGYDIAVLTEELPPELIDCGYEMIAPCETKKFRTGIAVEIPIGYYIEICGRSSTSSRGLQVIPGYVDSDFRGEVKVVVHNMSSDWVKVYDGERLAQFIVKKHEAVSFEEVAELHDTARGSSGFGSTGR